MLKYNISEIKNILYLEAKAYYEKKDKLNELNMKIDLYNELFLYFENIETIKEKCELIELLIDTLYQNSRIQYLFFELKTAIFTNPKKVIESELIADINKKYNKVVAFLNSDMEKILLEQNQLINYLKSNNDRIYRYKMITQRLKNKQIISDKDKSLLFTTLNSSGYTTEESIKFLESVSHHNLLAHSKFKNLSRHYKSEVLEMLNFGFEIIDDENIDYTTNTSKIISIQNEQLQHYEDINEFLKITRSMCATDDEYKAVLMKLIEKQQNEILDLINMITEEEFYFDEDIKNEIISEYNLKVDYYLHFREEYMNITMKDEEIAISKENYLIYPKGENNKPYFVEDLKKIDKNCLSDIKMLLENLQLGSITKRQLEGFKTNYGEFRKLKYGQVRIIIKQISKNIFMIVGVFIKKEQTGDLQYRKICNRKILDISMEELQNQVENSEIIQQEIYEFIKENARLGNR